MTHFLLSVDLQALFLIQQCIDESVSVAVTLDLS